MQVSIIIGAVDRIKITQAIQALITVPADADYVLKTHKI